MKSEIDIVYASAHYNFIYQSKLYRLKQFYLLQVCKKQWRCSPDCIFMTELALGNRITIKNTTRYLDTD